MNSAGLPELAPGFPAAITLPTREGGMVVLGRMQGIDGLIRQLQYSVGQPVVDKTGLTGKYDFTLTCSREDMAPPPDMDGSSGRTDWNARGACLSAALPKQLGLRLHA